MPRSRHHPRLHERWSIHFVSLFVVTFGRWTMPTRRLTARAVDGASAVRDDRRVKRPLSATVTLENDSCVAGDALILGTSFGNFLVQMQYDRQ